eukprot:TRINITY_DN3179_c0_g1_i1.p1 TRINITY_DN3179_c0_g1~~TRINITY_DN3179_c0_g1_i1.p1  ORF type:complete len:206 (+),score=51.13 TRINITY_DN3179_c0_g1_i1:96-713(+)
MHRTRRWSQPEHISPLKRARHSQGEKDPDKALLKYLRENMDNARYNRARSLTDEFHRLSRRGNTIAGRIFGESTGRYYHVEATLGDGQLNGCSCSCPDDVLCKHIAALVMNYLQRRHGEGYRVLQTKASVLAKLKALHKEQLLEVLASAMGHSPEVCDAIASFLPGTTKADESSSSVEEESDSSSSEEESDSEGSSSSEDDEDFY